MCFFSTYIYIYVFLFLIPLTQLWDLPKPNRKPLFAGGENASRLQVYPQSWIAQLVKARLSASSWGPLSGVAWSSQNDLN